MPDLDDAGRASDNPAADETAQDLAARQWASRQQLPALSLMMLRGMIANCPVCGRAPLYRGYLSVVGICRVCGAPLGRVRADDAPPYFTIFITAHIIIALVVITGRHTSLPVWAMIVLFLALTMVIALLLLRPIKGATVGAALRLGLIGER